MEEEAWNQYIQCCSIGNIELLDYLIKNRIIDVNQTDDRYRSGLHFAVCKNRVDVVNYLLNNGIDINLKDINNNTALHIASINGFSNIVSMILQYSSSAASNNGNNSTNSILLKDMNNNTPLQLASSRLKRLLSNIKSKPSTITSQERNDKLKNELNQIINSIIEYINITGSEKDKLKMSTFIQNFQKSTAPQQKQQEYEMDQDDDNEENDEESNQISKTIDDLEDLLGSLSL